MNTSILRGAAHPDQKHKDLYEAEEMIKKEMLLMMQHDLLNHPTAASSKNKTGQMKWRKSLEDNLFQKYSDEEMAEVCNDWSLCGYY